MNYFELHIGDYAQATAHLSFVEDAAYNRLLRKYYSTESPLPSDIKQVQRLVCARTKDEKIAVETVLREFFFLDDDGWHNKRCDAELGKFLSGEPERELRKTNETNRLKRHREERANLFKAITDAGLHADWNIGIRALREMVANLPGNVSATAGQPLPATPPATAPATPATATQYPVPSTQYPEVNPGSTASTVNSTTDARVPEVQPAMLSKALRECGIEAQSADPRLIALAKRGVKPEALQAAAAEAKQAKPGERIPAGYVIAIVDRWTSEAESIGASSRSPPPRAGPSSREEGREQASRILTGRGKKDHGNERDITGEAVRIA